MTPFFEWFKPRVLFYLVHLIGYFAIFLITGWQIYPHNSYLWHTLYHFTFSIFLLFIFSFYSIRLLLFTHKYPLFILSCFALIFLSWLVAYFIYPQAGNPKINLFFFLANRVIFFLVPAIIEIIIQNIEIKKKYEKIHIVEKILQLNQQITPHLLFNILTSIHYQILLKSPKAEILSLKLRDLMEYSINQSTNVWTTIENEINFLKSYIDVEKLSTENENQIYFHAQNEDVLAKVPVMIFIVFVENAFKYSDINENTEGFIEVILDSDSDNLLFQITNSKSIKSKLNKQSKKTGLENVKNRLKMMFDNHYELVISEQDKVFQVNLKLSLSKVRTS